MSTDFFHITDGGDLDAPVQDLPQSMDGGDVPQHLDTLPDSGREVLVVGDVEGCKDFNHLQGDNRFGYQGTCGLVACEDILRQFGKEVTEEKVVEYAIENNLCNIREDDPSGSGGTTMHDQVQILEDAGVPANIETGATLSDLRRFVEEGRGVILEVNAGVLWNDVNAYDQGQANHAIVLTGAAVDPQTSELVGFYVNDSGRGDSGEFIPLAAMNEMWVKPGGLCAVTETIRSFGTEP